MARSPGMATRDGDGLGGVNADAAADGGAHPTPLVAKHDEGLAAAPAATATPGARLFVCGQQTKALNAQLSVLLALPPAGPTRKQAAGAASHGRRRQCDHVTVKAAMPPFNRREGMRLLPGTVEFDAPVFGPAIADALVALFDAPGMAALAAELGVLVPRRRLDPFVQGKAAKVQALVEAARARTDCRSGANAAAVGALAGFLAAFERLAPASVTTVGEWRAFCGAHCPEGWETHLHYDNVLPFCFGFEPATAKALRAHAYAGTDLEAYSLRWLVKALNGYAPEGCIGDVVNLAFAMQHPAPPAALSNIDHSEGAVVAALADLKEAIGAKGFTGKGLWIPTHLCHDGESDDTLSWLLLEHVRRKLGAAPLHVLAQLPTDKRLDGAAAHFARKGCAVFRDGDSRNAEAALKNLGHLK